ncbi:LpxL/LpxP family acyltransferase [Nocardioides dilutus]
MPGAAVKRLAVAGLRRTPLALSTPVVRRRVRRAQADPVARDVARRQMEFLLGASRPEADLDAAALRHLEYAVWRRELRWHPKVITRQPVTGIEHLTRVRGADGGLILCFLHHGRFDGAFGALKRAGAPPITTVGHQMLFDSDKPAYLAAHLRVVEKGSTMVPATLGYDGLRDLVLEGHTLAIAVDLPGSTRVRFLGRDLRCASGAARIAFETDTPVVLVLARQTDGVNQRLQLTEPLIPGEHGNAVALLQSMLDRFEPAVLDWPEAYDWPRPKFVQLDADGQPVSYERDPGEPDHVNP